MSYVQIQIKRMILNIRKFLGVKASEITEDAKRHKSLPRYLINVVTDFSNCFSMR